MTLPTQSLVALDQARSQARERIGDGYARDLIDGDELDRRLEALERAATLAEIHELVADLDGVHAVASVGHALVPVGEIPPTQQISAWFSETKRTGRWTPARHNHVQAIAASVRLDLREAQLGEGVTVFSVKVVMGELEIVAPPGLAVDVECSAFFGEVDQDESVGPSPDARARVRIEGRVWLGSISVREQLVGEGRSEARKRRKAERKRLAEATKQRKMLGRG